MTQTEALYHLQEIDLNLVRTQKRLQEIDALLADQQIVGQAQNLVSDAQKQLNPLQTQARNLELEIQSNTAKIRATDEQLYGGRVKNPKELQEMQQEIQSLKKRNNELEDHLLETMLSVEEAEISLTAAQAHLSKITEAWENEHGGLLDEKAQLEAQVGIIRQQREQALSPISSENRQLYNTLRAKKNNQPVSLLNENTCSVCGVEQTLAVVKNLRQGQGLVYCENCGRILVAKN